MYPDATLKLVSLNGTFATKSVAIPEGQSILIGRLTDPQDLATIPKFASKVVSRNHASLSHQGGRVRLNLSSSLQFHLESTLFDAFSPLF